MFGDCPRVSTSGMRRCQSRGTPSQHCRRRDGGNGSRGGGKVRTHCCDETSDNSAVYRSTFSSVFRARTPCAFRTLVTSSTAPHPPRRQLAGFTPTRWSSVLRRSRGPVRIQLAPQGVIQTFDFEVTCDLPCGDKAAWRHARNFGKRLRNCQ